MRETDGLGDSEGADRVTDFSLAGGVVGVGESLGTGAGADSTESSEVR